MESKSQKLISDNCVTIKNLFDLEQNMMDLLEEDATVCYKNCDNMKINIDSKINKVAFEDCHNIEISLNGIVTGIDINSSESVRINNQKNQLLNVINIIDSNDIKVLTSKDIHNKTIYNIDSSYGIIVQDHTKKSLKVKR